MKKFLAFGLLSLGISACAPQTKVFQQLPTVTVSDSRTFAATCAQVAANVRAAAPSARPTPLVRASLWSTLVESSSERFDITYLSKNNISKDDMVKMVAACKQLPTSAQLTLTTVGPVAEGDLHAMHQFILSEIRLLQP